MAEYDNTNQFAFFLQTEKKADNHPDFKSTGQYALTLGDDLVEYITNGGRDLEFAGWSRESQGGRKFVSVQVSKPYQKEEADF